MPLGAIFVCMEEFNCTPHCGLPVLESAPLDSHLVIIYFSEAYFGIVILTVVQISCLACQDADFAYILFQNYR